MESECSDRGPSVGVASWVRISARRHEIVFVDLAHVENDVMVRDLAAQLLDRLG